MNILTVIYTGCWLMSMVRDGMPFILNELVTARRGEEVEIPVYITREKGANKQANITLIAVAESDSKVGSRAVLNIGQ